MCESIASLFAREHFPGSDTQRDVFDQCHNYTMYCYGHVGLDSLQSATPIKKTDKLKERKIYACSSGLAANNVQMTWSIRHCVP